MIIIMNWKGFVIAIAGLGIAFGLRAAGLLDTTPALLLMGLLFIVLDLVARRPEEAKELFGLEDGGHFFFVPMWIIGIIAIVGFGFFW